MKNRIDNYPTRKTDRYSIIERKPNYSKPNIKSITPLQSEKFQKDGYLVIKNFYSQSEVAEIRDFSEKIFNGEVDCYTNKEPKLNQVRSALAVHLFGEIKVALNSKLISIAKSILGDSIYIHQSRINYKAGKDANGWNWHSDFETWHAKDGMPDMDCFTALVAIEKNTIENGCLKFIPKSHRLFISCPYVGEVNPEDEFSEQKEGVPDLDSINEVCRRLNTGVINIECEAGDMILFDCNLLHSSDGNSTTEKRTNLYFVFNSVDNSLQDPFSDTKHRPEQMGAIANTKNL